MVRPLASLDSSSTLSFIVHVGGPIVAICTLNPPAKCLLPATADPVYLPGIEVAFVQNPVGGSPPPIIAIRFQVKRPHSSWARCCSRVLTWLLHPPRSRGSAGSSHMDQLVRWFVTSPLPGPASNFVRPHTGSTGNIPERDVDTQAYGRRPFVDTWVDTSLGVNDRKNLPRPRPNLP